jgi:hypothetical protein
VGRPASGVKTSDGVSRDVASEPAQAGNGAPREKFCGSARERRALSTVHYCQSAPLAERN